MMLKKKLLGWSAAGLLGVSCMAGDATPENAGRDVLSVIHSRKSVRIYQNKAITREQLETLLKAGMAAPTAADRRPWAFVAITDRKTLSALADVLDYGRMLRNAPAAIVVLGTKDRFLEGKDAEMWVQDCSAATENILLAAEGLGLGAVWLGVYPVWERVKAVAKIVGAPGDAIPLNVISIGWPGGKEKPKDKYDPSRIHWEKW